MIFLGSVQGGPEVSASIFGRMENRLMNLISDEVGEFAVGSGPAVNVVFHIPGSMLSETGYRGLREAKFSRKQKLLMIQVAVPKEIATSEDAEIVRRFLFDSLRGANDLASDYFEKKGIEYSPSKYLSLVDAVEARFQQP